MMLIVRPSATKLCAALLVLPLFVSNSMAESVQHFKTGAIPVDPETFSAFPSTPSYRAFLPESVDLSGRVPKVGDQGNAGTCVGWAVGYAARSYYAASLEGRDLNNKKNIPSPSYIYNSITTDNSNCDAGSSIPDALNLLKQGSLSLKEYPYSQNACSRPTEGNRAQASDFKIEGWHAVNYKNADQLKGELAKGNPVIISIKSSDQLERIKGTQIYERPSGKDNGSHAVTVVGYDENRQAFKFINSWGRNWGDKGFGWISYEAFKTEAQEAYVILPIKPQEIPVANIVPPVVPTPKPAPSPPEPEVTIKPDIGPDEPITVTDVGCGRVSVTLRGGHLVFTGFVGSDEDQRKLAAQAATAGAKLETVVRPWPQCEVLLTLDKALAQSDRPLVQIENVDDKIPDESYLRFTVRTPSYPSFLYISYIQADGSVVTLIQPEATSLRAYPSHTLITLGDPEAVGPKFKVGAPFGREMLVVIASRAPLFSTSMSVNETERVFLTEIRRALVAKPDSSSLERVVSAGFDTITTVGMSVSPDRETNQ